jgi:hypothetical protein
MGGGAIKTKIEHERRQNHTQRGWIDADSTADPGSRQGAKANPAAALTKQAAAAEAERSRSRRAANFVLVAGGGGLHVAKPFLVQMAGFQGGNSAESHCHRPRTRQHTTD